MPTGARFVALDLIFLQFFNVSHTVPFDIKMQGETEEALKINLSRA